MASTARFSLLLLLAGSLCLAASAGPTYGEWWLQQGHCWLDGCSLRCYRHSVTLHCPLQLPHASALQSPWL